MSSGSTRLAALAALTALALSAPALPHPLVPGKKQERPVLLRGGDLYTVSHGVLRSTDLLFEDGKITRIGTGLSAPSGADVVDVSGKHVYPGLIAAYTSLGLIEIGSVRATRDLDEVGAVTPEVTAAVAFNPDSELIPTVRSHGITTAQVVPDGSLIRGRSFVTHLDGWTVEDSSVRAPDGLHVGWPPPAEPRERQQRRGPRRDTPRTSAARDRRELRNAFETARAYDRARAASDVPVDLRWEAMRPAFHGELPVFVAADDERQIVEVVSFAEEFGVDVVLVGARDAHRTLDLLREHDVAVVLARPNALPLREDEAYDAAYTLPRKLHEAGIRFCISSTDSEAWNERNLPLLAGTAVGFGLPAEQALRSITLSAAEILGVAERLGSLDTGKEATLFVSEGDVLDVLEQKVTRMWIGGSEVDLDNRHKQLWRKYQQKAR